MRGKFSIIIPTRNEEKTIADIIKKVSKYSDDIIVVDGHSKDNTRKIAESLKARVILDNGKGKGAALRAAIHHSARSIVLFMDADGSHETNDIPKLVKPILEDKADLVVASRMLGGSDELHGTFSNFLRNLGSNLVQLAINYRFNVRLTDCENGFRAIKRDVFKNLNLKANDFDIEEEIVLKALRKKYRVAEIPSHEYERKFGKSQLSLFKIGYKFIYRLLINMF